MSEQSLSTTPETTTRKYFRPDYEKIADISRRARHNATPTMAEAIDELTSHMVMVFTADNPNFDPAGFVRASQRRIETVDNAAYVAWAIANDTDPNDALGNESAFYAAGGPEWDAVDEEDHEDNEDGVPYEH